MNTINIAWKEIKHTYRDTRTLFFMLAFPILLMFVLGTALSNAFNNHIDVGTIHVLYKDEANKTLSQSFHSFQQETGISDIHFTKASNHVNGQEMVRQNKYDGYVTLNGNKISVYESTRNSIEGSIIQGVVTAFADKYNVVAAVAKVKPEKTNDVIQYSGDDQYIKTSSLDSARQPGAMDYYAIAMTTMIAFYAAIGSVSLIRGERTRNTADRLLAAPISKWEIFLGKIAGSTVVNALCLLLVIFFSKYAFKAYWGNHLGIVFLIVLTESLLATSLGLGVSYVTKTGAAARTIIMVFVQAASFIGGAYFKISGSVTNISPLTWANNAMTKVIYANDLQAAVPAISLNIAIFIILLAFAIVSMKKREGL